MVKNDIPVYEIISGAAIAFTAFLLIVPGFATDLFGISVNISFYKKTFLKKIF